MADAGNVSAAQHTRLLIEFPIGKVHVQCCNMLLSHNSSDSQFQDEWKRMLSTSLNTLEVKHPFSPHDLDVACNEANCITQRIIEFSSYIPCQRSAIESAMQNTLVPARRAKEKSRGIHSNPTVSKNDVYEAKCQVFRAFCVDKLQSHGHYTKANLLDAFNKENPESKASMCYFRCTGKMEDMKKEASNRALAASDLDFTDDEIRENLEDFKYFASTMLKLDHTITKKSMIEEYRMNVIIRGKRFYSPVKHFENRRITWDELMLTYNSMQESVVSPEGRAPGIVSSTGESTNLTAAAGSRLSVFEGEPQLEDCSGTGSPCQSPPPPPHQESVGASQFGLTEQTLESDEESCGAKRFMKSDSDRCKRRKTSAELNERRDFASAAAVSSGNCSSGIDTAFVVTSKAASAQPLPVPAAASSPPIQVFSVFQ